MKTKLPVLIMTFNRPDNLSKVLEAVSKVEPSQLYISIDGPRENNKNDRDMNLEIRDIISKILWNCEVHTNFHEKNLGIGKGVEAGITWFFENVTEGVVLEDDMIPHIDFFRFSEEMLDTYRNDTRIGVISGYNLQDKKRGSASYYFSRYPSWGYAMWRRTWQKFDSKLDTLKEFERLHKIDEMFIDSTQRKYWLKYFRKVLRGKFNFTDTRFTYSMMNADAYTIIPNVNLIENIGFGVDATNTTEGESLKTHEIGTIIHPEEIKVDQEADDYLFYKSIYLTLPQLIKTKIKIEMRKFLKKIL